MSLGSKCHWGASVIGEQISSGSKCLGSNCPGSNFRWGATVRGATIAGATVWGATFMDSFIVCQVVI